MSKNARSRSTSPTPKLKIGGGGDDNDKSRQASPRGSRPVSPRAMSPRKGGSEAPTPQRTPRGTEKRADGNGTEKKAKPPRPPGKDGADAADRVKVVVRLRPPLHEGEMDADDSALYSQGEKVLWVVFKGQEQEKGKGTRQYEFDRVLHNVEQPDIYKECEYLVRGVTEGFNGCVMCYGQTGAGKTHTLGNLDPEQWGIIPRALNTIITQAASDEENTYAIKIAYVQIYMEVLQDLLNPKTDVTLKETANDGVQMAGVTWEPVNGIEEALASIEKGNSNRTVAFTKMNAQSSRSHAVVVCHVERTGALSSNAMLYLVDLAGSERVKKSGADGLNFDEACSINQSLTTLGRCIQAMATKNKPPFRESKLTRMLSSGFGGSSRTTLVVCVGPGKKDSHETVNSLEFGQQAMKVGIKATANTSIDYKSLSIHLQAELDEKTKLIHNAEMVAFNRLSAEVQRVEEQMEDVSVWKAKHEAAASECELLKQSVNRLKGETEETKSKIEMERETMMQEVKNLQQQVLEQRDIIANTPRTVETPFDEVNTDSLMTELACDYRNLALMYRHEGKYSKAILLHQRALAIHEKSFGRDHQEVGRDLGNLGNVYCDQGKHAEALPLYQAALEIDMTALGPDHLEVANDLGSLGLVNFMQGKFAESVPLLRNAHEIMQKHLAADHPNATTILRFLFEAEQKMQEEEEGALEQ